MLNRVTRRMVSRLTAAFVVALLSLAGCGSVDRTPPSSSYEFEDEAEEHQQELEQEGKKLAREDFIAEHCGEYEDTGDCLADIEEEQAEEAYEDFQNEQEQDYGGFEP